MRRRCVMQTPYEDFEASPSSLSIIPSLCGTHPFPSPTPLPSPPPIQLPDHWIAERVDVPEQGPYSLVPKDSGEDHRSNPQNSNGASLPLVPKSSDEDEHHLSIVSPGYKSNDRADLVSCPTPGERSRTFVGSPTRSCDEMAKKPSTSSIDRSDLVDFVVDNRSAEETRAIYNSWAPNYEEDMALQKYKAPSIMAQFINQELHIKKDAVILDVGCGTGLLGVQLKNLGYNYIDALDYSEEMMSEAKKKNIYKSHFLEKVFKNNKLTLKDAEYDVVALCGCLMPGHIMPDALPEVARLVKPNGRLMWIHRTLDHYEFRMEIVVRKKVQEYRLKCDGQIFALKKKA
ncbi:hypothetical protein HPB52_025138 [Rhipicephalus sanguineus]|uniref:Methyltransferase domain-containing protein n=1 Tax=Rhipicephalus sanguineus TaxID=34632 RepID=A0A9D4YRM3_RHISA|nr:hypothetical protein HPB52_025138 [Rhipicephalus sanguineus]